jgi:sugar phosphate permease
MNQKSSLREVPQFVSRVLTGNSPSGLIDARDQVGVVDLLRSPSMWALAFTQGCGVYSHYFLLSWLPSYLATTRGLTILNTGFYVTIPYAVATVLALALARVCDRALTARQIRAGGRRIAVSISLLASSLILFAPAVNSDDHGVGNPTHRVSVMLMLAMTTICGLR